jgi:hypothetical protein
VKKAAAHKHPDVAREAYALRHAYTKVPEGFIHFNGGSNGGIKQVALN